MKSAIKDIILDKNAFMNVSDAKFLKDFDVIERKIYRAIKKQIGKMNKTNGIISFDEKNVNLVNQLDKMIANTIKTTSYPGKVKDFLSDFKEIKRFNQVIHKDLNNVSAKELSKLVSPVQKQMIKDTLDGLTGSGVNDAFIKPVRENIFKNVVAGTNITDLENSILTMVESDPERLGLLRRYAGQVARDSLQQYDGQVNARIAEEYDLDAFEYVGSLVDDSRRQCQRWVALGTLLKEDLEGSISWAKSSGQGMIPATTTKNFAVYRGGYNCRHSAVPYKMTDRERARYDEKQAAVEIKGQEINQKKLDEVQKDIDRTKKKNTAKKNNKNIPARSKIEDDLVLSTGSKETTADALRVVTNSDGADDIVNEFGTLLVMRTAQQTSLKGARSLIAETGKASRDWQIGGTLGRNTNGNCSVNNSFLNIKAFDSDIFKQEKIKLKFTEAEALKFFPDPDLVKVDAGGISIRSNKTSGTWWLVFQRKRPYNMQAQQLTNGKYKIIRTDTKKEIGLVNTRQEAVDFMSKNSLKHKNLKIWSTSEALNLKRTKNKLKGKKPRGNVNT